MTRFLTFSAILTLSTMHGNVAQALKYVVGDRVTQQEVTDVFNGRNYLYVEAEHYDSFIDTDDIGDGFLEVSKENPITSIYPDGAGQTILPASSNVSGTALIDLPGGQYSHDDAAVWKVQFATPGTYQFVARISVFETGVTPTNYGNEDSIWLPPSWNLNTSTDWIGFEKEHYNIENVDIELPEEGFALDPLGWETRVGDSEDDGRFEIVNWGIKSKGVLDFDASNGSPNPLRDGNFVWYEKPMVSNVDSNDIWLGEYGHRTTYIVTPEQVGEVLTFEIGTRETYSVLDGFAFIESPDTDLLDEFTQEQVDAIMETEIIDTPGLAGDFDESGFVDGKDFVIWQRDTGVGSLSDWQGNYGKGQAAAAAIPEPATWLLLITMGSMAWLRVRVS